MTCSPATFRAPRRAIATLPFAALLLLATASAHAARNPDKPDKPDRIDKLERIEKLERIDKADRLEKPGKAERREMLESAARADRSDKMDRRDKTDRSGQSERAAKVERFARADRASASDAAPAPSLAPDSQFDGFRLIVDRNIFNPNRVGRTRPNAEERPPRIDVIALVGTMHSDNGVVAFFDSPDPTFRKTLREGQSVGGFKVERIRPDGVDLAGDDKPVSLKVAQELRRTEGGDWSVAATEPPRADSGAAVSRESPASSQPAPPPPIPPDASDALRRLMEQRQKQLKQ